jgi:hypothetical protein
MLIRKANDALRESTSRKHQHASLVIGVHLAIFVEPYLTLILEGRKTIESRFGVQNCAPHGRVRTGDLIFLKESSGPVLGFCRVAETWFFDLEQTTLVSLRKRFADELCARDPEFWRDRAGAKLATLMRVEGVTEIPRFNIPKRDRRGWVTIRQASTQLELI